MDCEQVAREELVEKHLHGQLEPALDLDFQAHILECRKCLALLETCEDIRDDLAPQAAAIRQKPERPFWSLGGFLVSPRVAALAGLACLAVVIVAVGVRTGVIPGLGGRENDISKNGTKQAVTGSDNGQTATFPEIAALSPAEQPAVRKAIASRALSYPPDLADLRGKQATLLAESPEDVSFRVLEPAGEVVSDPRPLFRWQPLAGALSYSVAILDTKGNRLQTSPTLGLTQWKAAHPLQRGRVYQWKVIATTKDGQSVIAPSFPRPKAKFRVIDQAKADELERFRQAHPEAHLVLGILYAEAGLLKNAEQELEGVPRNSRDFELASDLSRGVRALRPDR